MSVLAAALSLTAVPSHGRVIGLYKFDPGPNYTLEGQVIGTGNIADASQYIIGGGSYYGQTNAYVNPFNYVVLPKPPLPFAVSTWFHSDVDTAATDSLFCWASYSVNPGAYNFRLGAGSKFVFEAVDKSYTFTAPTNPLDRQWHHVALSSATGGAPYKVFFDGVELTSPVTATITAGLGGTGSVVPGGNNDGQNPSKYWDGWLDDFGMLDEAPPAEVWAAVSAFGHMGIGLTEFGEMEALVTGPAGGSSYFLGQSWGRVSSGMTGAVGSYGGSIAGGDAYIVTAPGKGIRMGLPLRATSADVVLTPSPITASVPYGQTTSMPVHIANSSTTLPLDWQISGLPGQAPSLEAVIRQLHSNGPEMRDFLSIVPSGATLSNGYLTGGPYVGTYDGGGDYHIVFPTSNSSNRNNNLPIIDDQAVHLVLGPGSVPSGPAEVAIRYNTYYTPDLCIMSADLKNISSFYIGGANSLTYQYPVTPVSLNVRGIASKAWFYGVQSQNLTIQHILIIPPDQNSSPATPSGEGFVVAGLPAACRVYDLWFTTGATPMSQAALTAAATRFLELVHGPDAAIIPSQASGTLAPGAGSDLTFGFDATGLAPGMHTLNFAVTGRDEVVDVPGRTYQTVNLQVQPPSFTVTPPPATIAIDSQTTRHDSKIILTSTDGSPLTPQFSFDAAWLRVIPSENRPGEYDLYLDTTGMLPGTYGTTVTIVSGGTTMTAPVTILVQADPVTSLIADPTRPRVYGLSSGAHPLGSDRNMLYVLDSTTGKTVRTLDVGHVYSMVLSADRSCLYGITSDTGEIVRIDLNTMTAIPTGVLLPGAGSTPVYELTAGPGTTLYYLTSKNSGLTVVNAANGALLQTIDTPGPDLAFQHLLASPDFTYLAASQVRTAATYTQAPCPMVLRYAMGSGGLLTRITTDDAVLFIPPTADVNQALAISADGSTMSCGSQLFHLGKPSATAVSMYAPVTAISAGGEFIVGPQSILTSDGVHYLPGAPNAFLPSGTPKVITEEGRMFYAPPNDIVRSVNIRAAAGDDVAGFRIFPASADQSVAHVAAPPEFRWLPVDGARDYRLYASKDPAALSSPVPDPAALVSRTSLYSAPNPLTMSAGETWYWRVDAIAPQGLVPGSVRSFTVAGITPDRVRVDTNSIIGCRAQAEDIRLTSAAPQSWTATSNQPWLTFVSASGTTPDTVHLKIDTTAFNGDAKAIVTLQSAGATVDIPVSIRMQGASKISLVSAIGRNKAFALMRSSSLDYYGTDFLASVDPATGSLLSSRPVGFGSTVIRFSPDERQMALSTTDIFQYPYNPAACQVFNTDDLRPVAKVVADLSYPQVALGLDGKVMFGDRLIHWPDFQVLGMNADYPNSLYSTFSPDGNSIYGGGGISQGYASRLNQIDATQPSLPVIKSASTPAVYGADLQVLAAANNSIFAFNGYLFDKDLNILNQAGYPILSFDLDARIAYGVMQFVKVPSLESAGTLSDYYTAGSVICQGDILLSYLTSVNGIPQFSVQSYSSLLPPDQQAALAVIPDNGIDSDGDGISDLIEIALGSDPQRADSRPVAGIVITDGEPAFVYECPQNSNNSFVVQISDDLATWQDLPASSASAVPAETDGQQRVTVHFPDTPGRQKIFARLKIASVSR